MDDSKGGLLSRETGKWGGARWNGIQNQKVFYSMCLCSLENDPVETEYLIQ